jgi:hypothetical protein
LGQLDIREITVKAHRWQVTQKGKAISLANLARTTAKLEVHRHESQPRKDIERYLRPIDFF